MALGPDDYLVCPSGVPFHGIPSRAAVTWLHADGADWFGAHPGGIPAPKLAELHVLSLTESAEVATRALHWVVGAADFDAELWNIKEGHSASVWFAAIADGRRSVLNVGRDPLASAELAAVTERLRTLPLSFDRVAEVLDGFWVDRSAPVGDVDLPRVYVASQELITDAFEIHSIEDRYAFVERFITDSDVPSKIVAVRGRWADDDETAQIEKLRVEFERVAGPLGLALTINDGDLVWVNGRGPVVVAAGLTTAAAAAGHAGEVRHAAA
jgi:hypothetical protein